VRAYFDAPPLRQRAPSPKCCGGGGCPGPIRGIAQLMLGEGAGKHHSKLVTCARSWADHLTGYCLTAVQLEIPAHVTTAHPSDVEMGDIPVWKGKPRNRGGQ
jgi:hypothetical protein